MENKQIFTSNEEINKHLSIIEQKIDYIEKHVKKEKFVESYYEGERNILFYITNPENKFNFQQIKFLKAYSRNKLYQSYCSNDNENRLLTEKNIDEKFKLFIEKIRDDQDIKFLFGDQFSISNLNAQLHDIEQLSYVLKAMDNSLLSEVKAFICIKLNIDAIPLFLIRSNKKLLKQKVRRLWKVNYEIPVNNLKLESKFGYKFLNQKFLDLINEMFNLFDSNSINDETKLILFDIFVYSNYDYLKANELNISTFLNNLLKYIYLMGLHKKITHITDNFTKIMSESKNELNTDINSLLVKKFEDLKNILQDNFSIMSTDREKLLIIIFSFSIMLNNLMAYQLDNDGSNSNAAKIVFSPELKCSSRERQFLINLLINFDFYLNKDDTEKFSCIKINYMLENSIFSSLIKSYTQIIFDEEYNKTKVIFDQKSIFEHFNNTCNSNSELIKLKEMFNKFMNEINIREHYDSKIKQVTSDISNKFKSFLKTVSSKIIKSENNQNKINIKLHCLKLVPFDPINISSHICICINGHFLEGDIDKLWRSFTINEKSVDYYFFHWLEENKNNGNFFTDARIQLERIKHNLTYDEAKAYNKKEIFKRNKYISKVFGKILAYIIATRSIFKFHVISLIGYSLGCNVIKHCIFELNKIYDYHIEVSEIIQNIVFIGGATKLNPNKYKFEEFFKIIAGRIINCFSDFDSDLKDVYSYDAIGVNPLINNTQFDSDYMSKNTIYLENYDLSEYKYNHDDYKENLSKILNDINIL